MANAFRLVSSPGERSGLALQRESSWVSALEPAQFPKGGGSAYALAEIGGKDAAQEASVSTIGLEVDPF